MRPVREICFTDAIRPQQLAQNGLGGSACLPGRTLEHSRKNDSRRHSRTRLPSLFLSLSASFFSRRMRLEKDVFLFCHFFSFPIRFFLSGGELVGWGKSKWWLIGRVGQRINFAWQGRFDCSRGQRSGARMERPAGRFYFVVLPFSCSIVDVQIFS